MIKSKETNNCKQKLDIDFFNDINVLLKSSDYDKKILEQKIELAWLDIKNEFTNCIRQKNMYNKINIMFNKGNNSVKYELFKSSLDNFNMICSHEHSKQFVITLANDNKKYLVIIVKKINENIRELICNRNGVYVLDEIYKLCNRKSRNEMINNIISNVNIDNGNNVDNGNNIVNADNENNNDNGNNIVNADNGNYKNNGNNIDNKNDEFGLIKKLSSKRLWKYEITHHFLYEYISNNKNMIHPILDLFIRNKQLNLVLKSFKGLKASLLLLNETSATEILRIISKDIIEIVNNEYSVIFILKILELNSNTKTIIDLYLENYKEIFINESSVLPLLYVFNQEKKYYPTLFNHLRTKDTLNTDKKYLIEKFKDLVVKHLKIFCKSFTWILIYFFCKKDEDIKKMTVEFLKTEDCENLRKKMKKYKLIK